MALINCTFGVIFLYLFCTCFDTFESLNLFICFFFQFDFCIGASIVCGQFLIFYVGFAVCF